MEPLSEDRIPMVVLSHNGLLELPSGRILKHVFPGMVVYVTQEELLDRRLVPVSTEMLALARILGS